MLQALGLLEAILFGAVVCLAIKCYELGKQDQAMKILSSSIPGPVGLPIIGVALKLLNKRNFFQYLAKLTKVFGSPLKFFYGPAYLFVGVNTPEDVKVILNSENSLNKAKLYKFLKLNNALFVADKEIWRVHRKLLTPAFNKNMIISAIPVINKTSMRLRKILDKKVDAPDFDWLRYITIMVLETTFENILGVEADDKNVAMLTKYMEDSIVLSNCSVERMTVPYLHPDLIYRFSKCHQIEKKVNVEIENFFESVLDKKLCEREEFSNNNIDDESKTNQKFIDLLLKEENNFSYEEKRDHMRAIVYGGSDTSSFTVSTALLMIAMHKDVQDKAFAEIKNCLPVPDQPIDLYAVNQMSYLEQVVKEVMRLFPAAGIVARETTGDVVLEKHTIPSETLIVINVLELHRSPLIWGEDAHLFNPKHFDPERLTDIHSSAYQPFTNGPRICLAYKYAMIFLKVVLADLLRNYELETTLKYDELDVDFSVLLKIQQGHRLRIKKRIF